MIRIGRELDTFVDRLAEARLTGCRSVEVDFHVRWAESCIFESEIELVYVQNEVAVGQSGDLQIEAIVFGLLGTNVKVAVREKTREAVQ